MSGSSNKGDWAAVDSFVGSHTSPALTGYRPCPICGRESGQTFLTLTDFQMYSDSNEEPKRLDIRHQRCRSCFALYMNPVYTRYGFEILFREAGQSYGSTAERPPEQLGWLTDQGLLKSGGSVLDVGCYDGQFLELLPDDLHKIGVDIDRLAIERGRERMGDQNVELIHGEFESFTTSREPDTMTMFHVLEHVSNPVEVLRKLRSLAHDGSRLVIEVPVVEFGATNDLVGFFSSQHTTHFSRRSLRNCLLRAGWEPQDDLYTQMEYNGCRVVAAPGPEVDVVGDPGDTDSMRATLIAWEQAAQGVSAKLEDVTADRCVIWGGGTHVEYLYQRTTLFHEQPDRQYAIVDSDPEKHGTTWRGVPIHPPADLTRILGTDDGIPIVISSYGSLPDIRDGLSDLGIADETVVGLYDRVSVY